MSSRALLALAAAVGAWLFSGCSSEPAGPTEGTFTVTLASPNSDDGAVLFTLAGGPVDSVAALGHSVYSARLDDNTVRVIVVGALASGPLVRIRIPDHRQISAYSVVVNQVAARTSYQQRDPSAYSVSVAP
jgi:hypothetical protein